MTAFDTDNVTAMFGNPSKPFSRGAEVTLTVPERTAYGEALARKKILRDHMQAEAKEEARKRKNAIADVSAEVDRLAAAVDTGKEFREVQVYSRLEGANVVVRTVDGDVEVDRRAVTAADQQIQLPGLDDDDFASGNYQDDVELVRSSTGATVAVMGHDDEGETPSENPITPAAKTKRKPKAVK